MRITNELRKWIDSIAWLDDSVSQAHKNVFAIADRIDAEHEAACAEAYGNGVQSVTLSDMTAYAKLPVDADGVPIRVGDEMDVGIVFAIGDEGVFMVENGFSGKYDVECFDGFACHHVQPDSWERIIEDARTCLMSDEKTEAMPTMRWKSELAELVERCKRLAGE